MSEIRTACNKDIYDIYTEKAVSRIRDYEEKSVNMIFYDKNGR